MSWRSPKLLRAAKDQACVLCGSTGTTVAAHANSVALGKGTGIKAPDYYVAWVCQRCHGQIDGQIPYDGDRRHLWEWAFIKTVAQWFEQGIVVVK